MRPATVWLLVVTPRVAATGASVTVRLAGGGKSGFKQLGVSSWWAGLQEPPSIVQRLGFDDGEFGEGSIVQALELRWGGTAKRSGILAAYYWRDATFTLYSGPEGGLDADYGVVLSGRIADALPEPGRITLQMADPAVDLARPVLAGAVFAGTGGIEGVAELKGRPKRRAMGNCRNVELWSLDPATNIWVATDPARPLQAIDQVYDRGNAASSLTTVAWAGSIAATLTALQAAAAPQGGAAIAPSIGCIKWWFANPGKLSCDLRGEVGSGYVDRPADIAAWAVAAVNGPAVNAASLTAARGLRNIESGLLVSDDSSAGAIITRLLSGVSLWWGMKSSGEMEFGAWAFGASAGNITASRAARVKTHKPVKRLTLGWRPNNMVMNRGDIAASLFWDEVTGGNKPADGATNDLTLTAIGTAPPLIQGNKLTNNTGQSSFEVMVRGGNMPGPCFAECDIEPTYYTIASLDGSATDKSNTNQELYVQYHAAGGLIVRRGSTDIVNTTIAAGLVGKLAVAYDGVRYRAWVAGVEYTGSSTTQPVMTANPGPLTHHPKWTPYSFGSSLSGLRAGPFTDNNFGSIGGAGTPDPYATGSDNLIANASLAVDTSQWILTGSVARQGGGIADPASAFFAFSPSAGSQATANNGDKISILGATSTFVSGHSYKGAGATGTFIVVVEYYRADGSASAIRSQDNPSVMPATASAWVPFMVKLTPPADAASIRVIPYAANAVATVYLANLRVAKTEPAADVTSSAKVAVELGADKTVPAAYDGAVSSTDLGELRWSPKVTKGGASIKGDNGTTYALTNTYGGTFAVDNTNGSSTKGDITQSAITANTAGGELTVSVAGVAEPKIAFKVTKNIAAPPPPSGGGSTKTISWMGGDWNGLNTTSYSTVNALKSIAVASGETLYASGILDINVAGNGGVTRTMTLKIQYSPTGAGTWSDFPGGGHVSSTATSGINGGPPDYEYVEPSPGSVTMTDSKGGLSAGTYDVRVVGICSTTGKVCTPSGTLTVEAKV